MKARLVLLLAAAVGACTAEVADGPPEVRFGQAECVQCGMIVSDPRTAAALVAEVDGKRRDLPFDDIGDMVDYEQRRRDLRVIGRYVGDYATGQWVRVEEATLIRSNQLHTPMGSGIIAYTDASAAERKRAEVAGERYTYPQPARDPASSSPE